MKGKGARPECDVVPLCDGVAERVGNIPFGSVVAADGVTLVDHHEEQKALGVIAALRSEGLSLRTISEMFMPLCDCVRPYCDGCHRLSEDIRSEAATVQRLLDRIELAHDDR